MYPSRMWGRGHCKAGCTHTGRVTRRGARCAASGVSTSRGEWLYRLASLAARGPQRNRYLLISNARRATKVEQINLCICDFSGGAHSARSLSATRAARWRSGACRAAICVHNSSTSASSDYMALYKWFYLLTYLITVVWAYIVHRTSMIQTSMV